MNTTQSFILMFIFAIIMLIEGLYLLYLKLYTLATICIFMSAILIVFVIYMYKKHATNPESLSPTLFKIYTGLFITNAIIATISFILILLWRVESDIDILRIAYTELTDTTGQTFYFHKVCEDFVNHWLENKKNLQEVEMLMLFPKPMNRPPYTVNKKLEEIWADPTDPNKKIVINNNYNKIRNFFNIKTPDTKKFYIMLIAIFAAIQPIEIDDITYNFAEFINKINETTPINDIDYEKSNKSDYTDLFNYCINSNKIYRDAEFADVRSIHPFLIRFWELTRGYKNSIIRNTFRIFLNFQLKNFQPIALSPE